MMSQEAISIALHADSNSIEPRRIAKSSNMTWPVWRILNTPRPITCGAIAFAFGDNRFLAGGDISLAPAVRPVLGLDAAEKQPFEPPVPRIKLSMRAIFTGGVSARLKCHRVCKVETTPGRRGGLTRPHLSPKFCAMDAPLSAYLAPPDCLAAAGVVDRPADGSADMKLAARARMPAPR